MKKTTAFVTFTTISLAATTAWACGPTGGEFWMFAPLFATFLAAPYAVFSAIVIAAQRRTWFAPRPHRFWSWLKSSIGAWFFISLGSTLGLGLAFALGDFGNLQVAIALSTPLVAAVAHLMWLHSRRRDV